MRRQRSYEAGMISICRQSPFKTAISTATSQDVYCDLGTCLSRGESPLRRQIFRQQRQQQQRQQQQHLTMGHCQRFIATNSSLTGPWSWARAANHNGAVASEGIDQRRRKDCTSNLARLWAYREANGKVSIPRLSHVGDITTEAGVINAHALIRLVV